MKITEAQRAAVAGLPFILSDTEIMAQVNADGSPREFTSKAPMARARSLAQAAMNDIAGQDLAKAA